MYTPVYGPPETGTSRCTVTGAWLPPAGPAFQPHTPFCAVLLAVPLVAAGTCDSSKDDSGYRDPPVPNPEEFGDMGTHEPIGQ